MNEEILEGYASGPVPESIHVSGVRIGLVNGALAFGVPGIITGLEVGAGLGFTTSLAAFALGGVILTVLGVVTGWVGRVNRLTTCLTLHSVFGHLGARLISALVALSLLGWYGVNMDLLSAVLLELGLKWFELSCNALVIESVAGLLMVATTLFGIRLMAGLSAWLVPLMVLVVLYMAYQSLSLSPTATAPSAGSLSFGDGVSIVVGSFIVGVVLMPDFTRFARSQGDVISASVIPYLCLSSFVYVVAAFAGTLVASTDVIKVLGQIGMGSSALALVFVSAWLTNVVNLYSAGLGISAALPGTSTLRVTLVAGVFGTLAASLNLLTSFTDFLFALAVVFAPLAGVYVADFYLVQRQRAYDSPGGTPLNWLAIIAWASGIGSALLSQHAGITLFNLEALESFLIAFTTYLLLMRLNRDK